MSLGVGPIAVGETRDRDTPSMPSARRAESSISLAGNAPRIAHEH